MSKCTKKSIILLTVDILAAIICTALIIIQHLIPIPYNIPMLIFTSIALLTVLLYLIPADIYKLVESTTLDILDEYTLFVNDLIDDKIKKGDE